MTPGRTITLRRLGDRAELYDAEWPQDIALDARWIGVRAVERDGDEVRITLDNAAAIYRVTAEADGVVTATLVRGEVDR